MKEWEGRCCTDEYHRTLLAAKGESYRTNRLRTETSILKYTSDFDAKTKGRPLPVVTIPIVVHILYSKTIENIPDSQVYAQLKVLNNDYRKRNIDANKVPEIWKNSAADSRIEFMLAKKDPNGLPTTGITRSATNIDSFIVRSSEDGWMLLL